MVSTWCTVFSLGDLYELGVLLIVCGDERMLDFGIGIILASLESKLTDSRVTESEAKEQLIKRTIKVCT